MRADPLAATGTAPTTAPEARLGPVEMGATACSAAEPEGPALVSFRRQGCGGVVFEGRQLVSTSMVKFL